MTTQLTVTSVEGEYIFHIQKEILNGQDVIRYRVGSTHSVFTCMVIDVYTKDQSAYIEGVSHHPECSINKRLRSHSGTIAMMKGALKYILKEHPNLQRVDLTDTATKYLSRHSNKIQITPRRLVLGYPGWYEEHLHAEPTTRTKLAVQRVLHKVNLDEVESSWGSYEDIFPLLRDAGLRMEDINPFFNTEWFVSPEQINDYDVSISTRDVMLGGARQKAFALRVSRNVVNIEDVKDRIKMRMFIMDSSNYSKGNGRLKRTAAVHAPSQHPYSP